MKIPSILLFVSTLILASVTHAQDPLEQYIKRLRQSEASGGSETAFLSVGSTFLYGQGYFESKQYDLAAMYFKQAFEKDSTNAFVNYQIAASLLKQKNQYKAEEAKRYWQNAVRLNAGLQQRLEKEFPEVKTGKADSITPSGNATAKGIAAYIEALKYSQATGGSRTAMNSPGLDVLYGYGYYEKGDYDLAVMRFRPAVTKDPDDVYANYLLGVSLLAQDQVREGSTYLNKALAGDPMLKQTADADIAKAKSLFQQKQKDKLPKPSPGTKPTFGGKLVYGNYVCTETVWSGSNTNGGFQSPIQRGSFSLKPDGTYRWLDNGNTGRYRYDAQTGNITWLSGPLLEKQVKTSQFQPGKNIAQITLNFSESYRWECGCKK